MQGTLSKTLIFGASLLAPVTDKEIAKTDTSFLLVGLRALIGKMAFLVIVVIGGPTHVFIFPTRWLVAATIILSQCLSRVNSSARGGALRPGTAGAAITTISIVPILLIVPARSVQGLSSLETMRRHGLCLLEAE